MVSTSSQLRRLHPEAVWLPAGHPDSFFCIVPFVCGQNFLNRVIPLSAVSVMPKALQPKSGVSTETVLPDQKMNPSLKNVLVRREFFHYTTNKVHCIKKLSPCGQ